MLRVSCQEVLLAYDQVLAALRWVISPVVQLEDSQSPHAGTGVAKSHSQLPLAVYCVPVLLENSRCGDLRWQRGRNCELLKGYGLCT